MTREEAIDFCKNNPEAAAEIILIVDKLEQRIKDLEAKLGLNSSNSSKPPSSDHKLTKEKKLPTPKRKLKRGGQQGHKGKTLKMSSNPHKVKTISPNSCSCCGHSLSGDNPIKIEKRQLYDLPSIEMEITEYQSHSKICSYCNSLNKPSFPEYIKAPVQYGDNLKSFVSYCNCFQMLPYERIGELIEDLTSHRVSSGTIYNFLNQQSNTLEPFQDEVKKELLKSEVIHSDETGTNIQSTLHWVHVVSTDKLTAYNLHKKRGKEAMDNMNILPMYQGVVVHDHWSPYSHYSCSHSYCNAHILRELQGEIDRENIQWVKDMQRLLLTMNKSVKRAQQKGKESLLKSQIRKFMKIYEKILESGKNYYPPLDTTIQKQRGRPKQKKGKNLLDRLFKYKEETLRFLYDFRVPFTNNLAERDLRMIKVKEKISGCFASFRGGEIFCNIRGYISTLKKNNIPVLLGLKDALNKKAFVPSVA